MEKRKGREEEGGGSGVVGFNHLPPLHRFYSTSRGGGGESGDFYSSSIPYKASSVLPVRVFPFTSPQWQELQRQALIYKHIMAAVPVPPDLLLPISARAFPEAPPLLFQPTMGGQNGFNLRFGTNSTDPEPGRCRRTDGKKWRCSRDAAPDQKYCERHMNRGRPRSRKPVELKNSSNSKSAPSTADIDADVTSTDSLPKADTRYDLESLAPNQQWMQPHYEDLPNLNYTNPNDQCCPLLNPDLSVLDTPRSFIDAWSTDSADESKLPSLTLSMSNMNADVMEGEIQMGLGLAVKPPRKWIGGPLAEVLRSTSNMTLSPCGSGKSDCVDLINLMCSKSCCGSREASPRASSQTQVQHKLPVSVVVSDSSSGSNNSFQWMNCQTK